jgi:hypothetical protein
VIFALRTTCRASESSKIEVFKNYRNVWTKISNLVKK